MLPKQVLQVKGHALTLEVAQTKEERRIGLSGRRSIPDGTGMLFVFEEAGYHPFWMKNTYVPLVIYWLDHRGYVIDYTGMVPGSLERAMPNEPASMAVEVPLTWTHGKRIGYGDRFTFL